MMPIALLRTALVMFFVVLAGCATGPAGNPGGVTPTSPTVHTVVLVRGQQVVIADQSLTIELVEINDSRCPIKVTCIWAGHAAVTLQVSKPGSLAGRVVIGSEAPSSMKLPSDTNYGGYLFHLVELERGNADGSIEAVPLQRATISVSRLPQGQ